MRGGKGKEDYPSKGHKAFRLSFKASTMAMESVWKIPSFLFFLILKIFGAELIGHS